MQQLNFASAPSQRNLDSFEMFQMILQNFNQIQALTIVLELLVPKMKIELLRIDTKEIYAIIPINLEHGLHSYILYEDELTLVAGDPFHCIQQILQTQQGFKSYSSYRKAMWDILMNRNYKIPCATLQHTLFPIESIQEGTWINAAKIGNIEYSESNTNIQLSNNIILQTATKEAALTNALSLAYLCSGIIHHEYSANNYDITRTPLSTYIDVPITPVNKKIFQKIHLEGKRPIVRRIKSPSTILYTLG